jgi:hypothetical protein
MYINYVCVFQNYSVNQIRIYFLLLQEDLGTDYQIAYIDIKEGDKTGCTRCARMSTHTDLSEV